MKRLLAIISFLIFQVHAQTPLEIVIDADFSNHFESSQSIERGIQMAMEVAKEKDFQRPIVIKRADHRGNSKRSKRNINLFLKNPNGLALMSGIHSPPLLAHKNYINANKALFFVPWAAAGPITRSKDENNWIFRLSIDDSKAGDFLANYAAKKRKFKRPCLLLEDTGWGKSNHRGMTSGFSKNKIKVNKVVWFKWGIHKKAANNIANDLYSAKCDTVMLVANSKEGATLIKAIGHFNKSSSLPIISHWGITGGNFHEKVSHHLRQKTQLRFIQTKFNFSSSKLDSFHRDVLKKIIQKYPDISSSKEIKAQTGFVHAYDLGLILLNALEGVDLNKPIGDIREQLKVNLEGLKKSVKGLIKTYKRPFTPYRKNKKDAHEALGSKDFAIGRYGPKGEIYLD